ncbi:MAG: hypothetical protein M1823_004845 [Watsoniomyces obsoletus]|nr:MAG: hypothetical protein M1823_004845 [Watsoniomyces obsoletus]
MGNDALKVNDFVQQGTFADIHITTRGSNWLWAVTAVMTVAALAFFGLSFTRPRPQRLFHYLVATACLIAAISYFTMASNLGWTAIPVQFQRNNSKVSGVFRQIWYVRYIMWFVTTPLMLLALLLAAALPWHTILFTILLAEIAIICGLSGALVRTSYKWGFFAFACAALFAVLYHLIVPGRGHARPLGADVNRTYTSAAGLAALTALLYPIAWGLSEGGNVIAPDSEHIFYGILDLLNKPVLGALLLMGLKKVDNRHLGLHFRDYDDLPTHRGYGEKSIHHHNGVGDSAAVPVVPVTTTTAV